MISPCGFGRQRWASGEAGIHLNDTVLQRGRMQGILDIALSHNAQMTHYFNSGLSQHVVLLIGQSLAGCNHDGVTFGMTRKGY